MQNEEESAAKRAKIDSTQVKKKLDASKGLKVTSINTTTIVKPGFFTKAPAPKYSNELNIILNEAFAIISSYPKSDFHTIVYYLLINFNDERLVMKEAKRIKSLFKTAARILEKADITHWKSLLKHAIGNLCFGYSEIGHDYPLCTFYKDLQNIQNKSPRKNIEESLSKLHWFIINCSNVEQVNLEIEPITLLKYMAQFNVSYWSLHDVWLLLRSVTDPAERERYLDEIFWEKIPANKNTV